LTGPDPVPDFPARPGVQHPPQHRLAGRAPT